MKLPTIIQGGMGIAISNWALAKAVSAEGHLGVISGTGVAQMMISRLMDGDEGGHVRRALAQFPFQEPIQRILDKYYIAKPTMPKIPYIRPPMWTINPPKILDEITVIANFVEVFLAKEGHDNNVGINLLEKVQMPTMASLYGAMLAGVNFVIMGAGIPVQIPGILDKLANHEPVSYRLDVLNTGKVDDYRIHFDPQAVFSDAIEKANGLVRPFFMPIISSVVLAKALIKRSTGKVNGFVIEAPTAGGHNAPPRGAVKLNENGEPIYGRKDVVDFSKMAQFGLPFWLAGGYDSPKKVQEALAAGATGVQIGTAFAYCDESGMETAVKKQVIQKVVDEEVVVRTDPRISPTGFPFKVVQVQGTMSETAVYNARPRLCDIGLLRRIYKKEDGKVGYRCSSEPADQYVKKDGKLEETTGRGCLCNNLYASAGKPQHRRDGYVEAPLVTSGDGLAGIGRYLQPGKRSYSAKDVLDYLTGK
ncbi:MAG: nitronate monooxygenase [Chloroflexi bacterium]|nr:nitronate monooxygenase [Chloroflexota bacterium]